jgi:hypothetical protein
MCRIERPYLTTSGLNFFSSEAWFRLLSASNAWRKNRKKIYGTYSIVCVFLILILHFWRHNCNALRIAYFDCCFVGSSLRIGHIYCSGEQRSGDHFLSAFARNWREIWACWRRNLTHSGCLSHSHLNGRLMLLPGTLYSKWVCECVSVWVCECVSVWVCDLMEFMMFFYRHKAKQSGKRKLPRVVGDEEDLQPMKTLKNGNIYQQCHVRKSTSHFFAHMSYI